MKANRRSLLIRAGMERFSLRGYRDVSVEDIVSHCGLSVGTFYKYFPSKEVFYEQILGLIEREGIVLLDRTISRLHSPLNKLKAIYRFIVLGVKQYPILRGVLLKDPRYRYPGMEFGAGAVGNLRRQVEAKLVEIIREGSRKGVFRPGLYHDASRMVIALLDTVIIYLDDPDVSELTDDLLVMLQRGLRRVLRLRRRDERRDRRAVGDVSDMEWEE